MSADFSQANPPNIDRLLRIVRPESQPERLPDFDTPISINVSRCPNSCARFQLADIGLKGSIVEGVEGVEGFQVHLGGSLGADPAFQMANGECRSSARTGARRSHVLRATGPAPGTAARAAAASS